MITLYTYQLPFKNPFRYSGGVLNSRAGIILVYNEDGITAFGEAAPLPGFSAESLGQVKSLLQQQKDKLNDAIKMNAAHQLDELYSLPSLAFAIDTLVHDLAAKRANKSLFEQLFPGQSAPEIECNAVVPIQDADQSMAEIRQSIAHGAGTIKMKTGINFGRDRELLAAIRKQFPQIKIRIDANQAWDIEEAVENLRSLEGLNIEYCEQPINRHNLNGLAHIKQHTSIPIAADEAAGSYEQAAEIIKARAADILIIKPALIGNFKNIFVTKALADTHGIAVVFTTMMEAAVSRSVIAHLAAGLGNRNYAQGLATGNLLSDDVAQSSWLNKSRIRLPKTAGTGLQPNFAKLTVL